MKRTALLLIVLGILGMLAMTACAPASEAVEPEEVAVPAEEEAPAPVEEEAAPAEEEAAPTEEEEVPAEEEAVAETACPVEGGTIRIGMIQPMSGAAATNGAHITAAAQVAADNINAAGGVLGCDVQLIIEDSQADAAVALSAAEKLINQDNVQVIIGAYHSHATLAVMPILPDARVPMVEVIATSPLITDENNGWVFRLSSTNRIDAETAVTQCWDELGFQNWAFLPVNNDWGKSVPATFQPIVEELGGQLVLNEPLEQGSTNFLAQLTKLRASDVDTVAVTIDVESLSVFAKQAYESGMTADYKWIATSGNSVVEFQHLLEDTPEALENWYFIAYYNTALEGADQDFNQLFHDSFTAAHPDIPISNPSAQGYQAVYIIADAIERAGAYDGDAIREALHGTDFQGLTGHLQFDENGQAIPAVHFEQFVDGEPVVVGCN